MVQCSCGRSFLLFPALFDHQKSTGHCYCHQCDKNFVHEEALQQHKATGQHCSKCHCKLCGMSFPTKESLEQHSAALHSSRCGVCEKVFRSPVVLQQHQIANEHCYCKPCALFFAKREGLQQHCAALHPLTCGICCRKFAKIDALRAHARSTSHSLCQECGRYFINPSALDQHQKSFHRSQFHCCDCDRDFVDELALNQHLHTKIHQKPVTYPCSKCKRSFKSKDALNQHLASLIHKPLSDIKCVASMQCKGRFSAPSAMIQHLESGACCSGLNRKKLNLLVQSNDVDRVISDGLGKRILLLPPRDNSDSDCDSESSSDSCNGVPIFTPISSRAASPMLTPVSHGISNGFFSQNTSTNSLVPGLLTPRSSLDLSELKPSLAIRGLFCPLCPPKRKAFLNIAALEMHLASPKHAAKIFHCPSNLLAPTKTGKKADVLPARFSTLSGLTLHVESGACKGGKATLKAAIRLVEERLKDMGFQNPALLKT